MKGFLSESPAASVLTELTYLLVVTVWVTVLYGRVHFWSLGKQEEAGRQEYAHWLSLV